MESQVSGLLKVFRIIHLPPPPPPAHTVGWSDTALFCENRTWTHCCRSGILFEGQFRKIVKSLADRARVERTFKF